MTAALITPTRCGVVHDAWLEALEPLLKVSSGSPVRFPSALVAAPPKPRTASQPIREPHDAGRTTGVPLMKPGASDRDLL
jgi:hypothetical protein